MNNIADQEAINLKLNIMDKYVLANEPYSENISQIGIRDGRSQLNSAFQMIENAFRQITRKHEEQFSKMSSEFEEIKAKYMASQSAIKKAENEVCELQMAHQKTKDELVRMKRINLLLKTRCEKLEAIRKTILADLEDIKLEDIDMQSLVSDPVYGSIQPLESSKYSVGSPQLHRTSSSDESATRIKELFKLARGIMEHSHFQQFLTIIRNMNEGKISVDTAMSRARELMVPKYSSVFNEFEQCIKQKNGNYRN